MTSHRIRPLRTVQGLSLVEVLISVVILGMIMFVIMRITQDTGRVWKSSREKIEAFADARAAFNLLTRRLNQATLNGYYDYFDANGRAVGEAAYSGLPSRYGRQSELHFISGPSVLPPSVQITHGVFFQAPTGYTRDNDWSGLTGGLNALGYYVSYTDDAQADLRPGFVTAALSPLKHRFRLMQFTQPVEALRLFTAANATGTGWLTGGSAPIGAPTSTRVLVDNVVALVIMPKRALPNTAPTPLSGDFSYNSRTPWSTGTQPEQMHQLPPLLHVIMVAIDEHSAQRLCVDAAPPDLGLGPLFANVDDLEGDLATLEATLQARRVQYQIFRTDVGLRGAKWSQ